MRKGFARLSVQNVTATPISAFGKVYTKRSTYSSAMASIRVAESDFRSI